MSSILLADDHELIRSGLKQLIRGLIAGSRFDEAWDGASTFEKIIETEYQLIVLDVNMPATDSFKLVKSIISIKPYSKILVYSMNSEEVYAKKFLQLGAKEYVCKTDSIEVLEKAIVTVLKSNRYPAPT